MEYAPTCSEVHLDIPFECEPYCLSYRTGVGMKGAPWGSLQAARFIQIPGSAGDSTVSGDRLPFDLPLVALVLIGKAELIALPLGNSLQCVPGCNQRSSPSHPASVSFRTCPGAQSIRRRRILAACFLHRFHLVFFASFPPQPLCSLSASTRPPLMPGATKAIE